MRLESEKSEQPSVSVAPATLSEQEANGAPSRQSYFGKWLVAGIVVLILIALVWFGPQIWQLAQNEEALAAWVASLGWLGPVALVALNAIQIVVAPIPGYVVQLAAGFLFGPFWGGVWSSIGLLLGFSIAFWLARYYGRPLVGRLVGDERLAQWEHVGHSTSTVVWFVLLLSPIGDLPYFLAGLARVSFVKIFLLTLLIRVPSTFVVAAVGAGVMVLAWWQIALLMGVLVGILLLFLRYQDRIVRWSDYYAQQHVHQNTQQHVTQNVPSDLQKNLIE
jgi:uncharacterized membrane protein YdjX (TVP38/TMEM64 family)